MKQKINKKGNAVLAVVCLLIGLALIAGGIYLLATDGDRVTGGVMLGLGAFIVVLFACTMYLIVNFEKLQQKAEEKAALEAEKRRAERRLEADRLRMERAAAREAAEHAACASVKEERLSPEDAPEKGAQNDVDNVESAG